MPLPWKKTKTNRISRIVADLQPPSRGASLVVETGFPTSVIDLFVKNRDRIKRQSAKRSKKTKHFPPPDLSDSLAPPPSPDYDSRPLPNSSAGPSQFDHHHHPAPELELPTANADAKLESTGTLLVLAVKMFLAVIPVLSTRKLAIGITLSAFLLFLLQILSKFAVGFANPFWIWKRLFSELETATAADRRRDGFIVDRRREEEPPSSASGEIQVVEPNSDHEHEGLQQEFLSREIKLGYLYEEGEIEDQDKFQAAKNDRSRSAKLKAKFNKLIPKKLRSGKRVKSSKSKNKTQLYSEFPGPGAQDHDQENEHGPEWSCEEEDEDHDAWEEHQIWTPEETGVSCSNSSKFCIRNGNLGKG
ncbi:uncharacterized protein LOC111015704 [Momordica charantia]|uniref:Uncharacterized protein LOC111015704 n=1 Tax=Momordica charantia TaxID=3673 RepID=A0A6J1CYR6_MOMCH|nr:uncharacterized protein LOC111015704 [Momordica charantia]